EAMARPEFQELAEQPELRDLVRGMRAPRVGSWFEQLWDWVRSRLLHPPEARDPGFPRFRWSERLARRILYALLALAGAVLLALLGRALLLRWQERGAARPAPALPASLEDSQTENALDHSPDEWEQFAGEWLRRGDLRQAVRALYLALLVDLHRQRLID